MYSKLKHIHNHHDEAASMHSGYTKIETLPIKPKSIHSLFLFPYNKEQHLSTKHFSLILYAGQRTIPHPIPNDALIHSRYTVKQIFSCLTVSVSHGNSATIPVIPFL